MLPRINDAIGHLKLTQIRPQHLNDFYKTLSENGVRNLGAIAVAKKVLKKKVEALGQPKHVSPHAVDGVGKGGTLGGGSK